MNQKRQNKGDRRTLQRDFRKKKDDPIRHQSRWIEDSQLENERFEAYYKKQGILTEDEWEIFSQTARTELPVVFRINGRGPRAEELRRKLETDFFPKLIEAGEDKDGQEMMVQPPKSLDWYPDKLAWQFEFSRRELRRNPAFELLHETIKRETMIGNISRQEAVSMIPPLILDIHSHHRVLDMCAAPGSKTVQLLEMLHADQDRLPEGWVVANDVDFKRCNMMTHQVKRMVSPNIMIVSADAGFFPSGSKVTPNKRGLVEFDRILADVPCTGDGTTRKNPDVWRKWKLQDACGLHPLQLRIAMRGIQLLAVDGLLAYSTCSLNPLEDEAVVAEVYRRAKGALELVDLSSQLSELNVRLGKRFWHVQDDRREYEDYDTVLSLRAEKEEDIPLERCIRLLPHLNNSGGFFVALFKKIKPMEDFDIPTVQRETASDPNEGKRESYPKQHSEEIDQARLKQDPEECDQARPKQNPEKMDQTSEDILTKQNERSEPFGQNFKGVDPIISLEGHPLVESVSEFYGLRGIDLGKNLICRNLNNNEPKKAYFICSAVKELIEKGWDKAIRITSLGQQVLTRSFQRKAGSHYRCIYRFCQEGLPLVLPFVTKQKLSLSLNMMKTFLKEKSIKIPRPQSDHEDPNDPPDISEQGNEETQSKEESLIHDPEVIEKLSYLEQGGCIVLLDDTDSLKFGLPLSSESIAGLTSRMPFAVSAWLISPYTLNLMVPKEDISSLIHRLVLPNSISADNVVSAGRRGIKCQPASHGSRIRTPRRKRIEETEN